MPLGNCYGGFRYWRIPRRSPGLACRKISPPMGAGGYFMEVPWALPVGLHIFDLDPVSKKGEAGIEMGFIAAPEY